MVKTKSVILNAVKNLNTPTMLFRFFALLRMTPLLKYLQEPYLIEIIYVFCLLFN